MNNNLIEQALQIVQNKKILINIISKRVRQIIAGSLPMVEVPIGMDYTDIVLTEIIQKKLGFSIKSNSVPTQSSL